MSEWDLRMSQKDLHRVHVVRLTVEGRETVGRAAKLLGISARQMKRLRRKMKQRGIDGLFHANRGKAAWNKTSTEKTKQVLALARGRYQGLNDSHLTEKLKEKEKISLSRPTVRRILRLLLSNDESLPAPLRGEYRINAMIWVSPFQARKSSKGASTPRDVRPDNPRLLCSQLSTVPLTRLVTN